MVSNLNDGPSASHRARNAEAHTRQSDGAIGATPPHEDLGTPSEVHADQYGIRFVEHLRRIGHPDIPD
jgi:hypothetical protein